MEITTADTEADELVAKVVGCAQLVLRRLGAGRSRVVYVRALVDEFAQRRIPFQVGVKLPLFQHGVRLDAHQLVELSVHGCVIVDVTAADRIRVAHCAALRRRLWLTGALVGVVIDFPSARLVLGRVVVRHAGAFCLSGRTPNNARQSPRAGRLRNPPC
jgi:GxxExxY protein